MLETNAIFFRKVVEMETQPCVIEAIEVMSQNDYEIFSNSLLKDRLFIADKKDAMFMDSLGRMHCILALNEESGDGILIDSSGYDYGRYVAFMPNIKSYIKDQIALVADQIIKAAAENTSNGSWNVDFKEISERYELTVKENNGIGSMLLLELESREEMAKITLGEGGFDITLYLDYCKNISQSDMEQNMGM